MISSHTFRAVNQMAAVDHSHNTATPYVFFDEAEVNDFDLNKLPDLNNGYNHDWERAGESGRLLTIDTAYNPIESKQKIKKAIAAHSEDLGFGWVDLKIVGFHKR